MSAPAFQPYPMGPLMSMEFPIRDLQHFGALLRHLGTHQDETPSECLFALGRAIEHATKQLEERWDETRAEARALREVTP